MRGKKNEENYYEYPVDSSEFGKRAPVGFQGMRGKKDGCKRDMRFVGMRGKRNVPGFYDINDYHDSPKSLGNYYNSHLNFTVIHFFIRPLLI